MRVRWTAEARSDLVRLHEFLTPVNRLAAARAVQSFAGGTFACVAEQSPPWRAATGFRPREVRRFFSGGYELRYEIQDEVIIVLRLWQAREHR